MGLLTAMATASSSKGSTRCGQNWYAVCGKPLGLSEDECRECFQEVDLYDDFAMGPSSMATIEEEVIVGAVKDYMEAGMDMERDGVLGMEREGTADLESWWHKEQQREEHRQVCVGRRAPKLAPRLHSSDREPSPEASGSQSPTSQEEVSPAHVEDAEGGVVQETADISALSVRSGSTEASLALEGRVQSVKAGANSGVAFRELHKGIRKYALDDSTIQLLGLEHLGHRRADAGEGTPLSPSGSATSVETRYPHDSASERGRPEPQVERELMPHSTDTSKKPSYYIPRLRLTPRTLTGRRHHGGGDSDTSREHVGGRRVRPIFTSEVVQDAAKGKASFAMAVADLELAESIAYRKAFRQLAGAATNLEAGDPNLHKFLITNSTLTEGDVESAISAVVPQDGLTAQDLISLLRSRAVHEQVGKDLFKQMSNGKTISFAACEKGLEELSRKVLAANFSAGRWETILDAVMWDAPQELEVNNWLLHCQTLARLVRLIRHEAL